MPGRGPAPKAPEERASLKVPERGDWLTLPPLERAVLPPLPKGAWSDRTKRVWAAWRRSWVTGCYTDTEISMCLELAHLYEEAIADPKPIYWAEVRQWMDRLGLTMKGQRDLRLRLGELETETQGKSQGSFAALRLVDDAV